ncbi:hypothetical protein DAPPUDRAFT_99755 [Daphnia pulex]|uniref:Uncharacterized protein n=1 Tax=Daphnia pulex TaxID=6669 RepID=E9G862_DAPPU|nr:hypothetical protein DAPPUDRAFT_99755 [Daphnia pulex]|eukprot:EFX83923.1 hypothetical protein DAPPUDRAFT_99755 [Daphnia pulex]
MGALHKLHRTINIQEIQQTAYRLIYIARSPTFLFARHHRSGHSHHVGSGGTNRSSADIGSHGSGSSSGGAGSHASDAGSLLDALGGESLTEKERILNEKIAELTKIREQMIAQRSGSSSSDYTDKGKCPIWSELKQAFSLVVSVQNTVDQSPHKRNNKENAIGGKDEGTATADPLCLAASGRGRRPALAHDEDAHTPMRLLSFSRG